MKVYIVFAEDDFNSCTAVKVFDSIKKAEKYCESMNAKNNPEMDSWGYVSGVYHSFYVMEVE